MRRPVISLVLGNGFTNFQEDGRHGAALGTVNTLGKGSVGHDDKARLVVRNGAVDEGANFDAVGALLVPRKTKKTKAEP